MCVSHEPAFPRLEGRTVASSSCQGMGAPLAGQQQWHMSPSPHVLEPVPSREGAVLLCSPSWRPNALTQSPSPERTLGAAIAASPASWGKTPGHGRVGGTREKLHAPAAPCATAAA